MSADPNEAIQNFCAFTGSVFYRPRTCLICCATGVDDVGIAMSMLESNNWNLGTAVLQCHLIF